MSSERESEEQVHNRNINTIAGKMLFSRDYEKEEFKVNIPREGAALENLPYRDAEELLIKANDNYSQLSLVLAQASSARAFFKRKLDMKEYALLGDPSIQQEAKNKEQREFNMTKDEGYKLTMASLRTAETVCAYLERLVSAATETLQVVKKVRDAALARKDIQH